MTESEALFQRAQTVIPGGVHSPVRAFRHVGGTPIFLARGAGASILSVDGEEYLDFCGSWGPLILGHAHPLVVEAVEVAVRDGLTFGTPTPRDVRLAERVVAAFPAMDQVRFVSSGTEAVMTALRLARGVTGRDKILKFAGCYHGHVDALLVQAGSGVVTQGLPGSAGVPAAVTAETLVVPLNDFEALDHVFKVAGGQIAAAIIEAVPANNGLIPLVEGFPEKLRTLCTQHGALLIADEVITGFRLRYGGISDPWSPDLVTLGKIIGGGMPVGAVLGKRAQMEQLAPLGPVYQAGTLSGNPVAMAAGLATLDVLSETGTYAQLESLSARLEDGIDPAWPLSFTRLGSIFWGYGRPGVTITRADQIEASAMADYAHLHRHLLDHHIYWAPSGYEVGFLSTAHTPEDVDRLVGALGEFFRK